MKTDHKIVGQPNKEAILDIVRRDVDGISRAQIAERLNLSRSTVSVIVEDLLALGLVLERGAGASRGGRPPIVLGVNPDGGRVVGVDMGASHILVVVADLSGRVLCESQAELNIASGPEVCLSDMTALVAKTLAKIGCSTTDVHALGVGVPGPVIAAQGIVSSAGTAFRSGSTWKIIGKNPLLLTTTPTWAR